MRICSGILALVVLGTAVPAAQAGEGFGGWYSGFTLGSHTRAGDWYTTETRLRDDTRIVQDDPGQTDTFDDGTVVPFASDIEARYKDTAFAVGLVLGYNWQINNFVFGLEASAGAAPTYDGGDSPFLGLGDSSPYEPVTTSALRTSKPLAVGLTAGFEVIPGTLAYVRANLERIAVNAVGTTTTCPSSQLNYDPTASEPDNAPEPCIPWGPRKTFHGKEKLLGWGAGLGVEQKFGDTLGVRLEYRIAEYGKTKNLTVLDESPDNFGADAIIDIRRVGMVELGVIFHF
jgi:opacity protein-like surface antigen